MRLLILLSIILAFATTSLAQAADYDVICTEVGPKVVTPSDTVGVTVDQDDLAKRIADQDATLQRIELDEIELRLVREKRQATATKELLLDIQRRASTVCDDDDQQTK